MQGGVEDLKLNELISSGLIPCNEKASIAWLAFKDKFHGMNQDQFRLALLWCKKSHAAKGKVFVGYA